MNELAGQNLGGYQLEEEIGRGSMGVVYRGKQIALGREVAIKVLPRTLAQDASYVARFIREAQIIAGLNHPNIVQIYDAGQQHKLLYFVMEYIQGPTLSSLLSIDGMLPQHLAAEYAAQIADALDAAYRERNVIHRDIKPENLMLNRWGQIKVMDFGLARATGHRTITIAKALVGSLYYASPEQVWGLPLDNRSDIYALGVVLYEMVTGQRPFTGRSMPDVTRAILNGEPPLPRSYNPTISPILERVILTALARDRNLRYEHAYFMAKSLRSLNLQAPQLYLPPAPPATRATGATQPLSLSGHIPGVVGHPLRTQQTHPQLPFPIQMDNWTGQHPLPAHEQHEQKQVLAIPQSLQGTVPSQPTAQHKAQPQHVDFPTNKLAAIAPGPQHTSPRTNMALQVWQEPPQQPIRGFLQRFFQFFRDSRS
ncbi:MAG TPA: protein kinase [Ktedonosporobacter sp.]|nr:protein kinase [Ktedonosporobacter sp.]